MVSTENHFLNFKYSFVHLLCCPLASAVWGSCTTPIPNPPKLYPWVTNNNVRPEDTLLNQNKRKYPVLGGE